MRLLLTLTLACLAHALWAQVSFSNQTILLSESTIFSGAPIGIADMNGDNLDDIIRIDDTQKLRIEYQTLNGNEFETLEVFDLNNKQWSVCIADVDSNGMNDIFTGSAYSGLNLFLSNADGTAFSRSPLPDGNIFAQGANFADINNDGYTDLFVCHDEGLSSPYQNDGLGQFTLDYNLINTASTVPSDNSGNYGSIWTDYDNDGDLDLYISKCRQGVTNPMDGRRINLLFENTGNGAFTEVGQAAGLVPFGQSWAADFEDIDNDGDLDCFIINHDIPNALYENNGDGTFTDISISSGIIAPTSSAGPGIQVVMQDFDNNGFIDILYTTFGSNYCLLYNNGDKTFTNSIGGIPSFGQRIHSAATGDLNSDGFVDIYAGFGSSYNNTGFTPDQLFMSNGNSNNHFKVLLKGTRSNPNGIGARVSLHGSWGHQVREVQSGESYGIMNSFTCFFGLGTATEIDSLVVRWPSGLIDKVVNPNINQFFQLVEGSNCTPQTDFVFSAAGLQYNFQDASIIEPTEWSWTFGDGNSSTEQDPAHTFENPGTYQVCLDASSACGTARSCQLVMVECAPPQAAFEFVVDGSQVLFEDISTAGVTTWNWDFGDGQNSTEQNPNHTYINAGTFTVCLEVSSVCGTTEFCEMVTLACATPITDFFFQTDELTVTFEDNTEGGVTNWSWDFGDGSFGSGPNPTHTFDEPGTYTVCLNAANDCGNDINCSIITVSCPAPASDFTFTAFDLDVFFTAISAEDVTGWLWNFGDGQSSTDRNAEHRFSAPGNYNVCLTTTNICGSTQICESVAVACSAPEPAFTFELSGLQVIFTDGSEGAIDNWNWDFGDNNTASQPSPTHTFDNPGTYTVCLEVSGGCGTVTNCQDITVSCTAPESVFEVSADELSLQFFDASGASATEWVWNFGDGTLSMEQNPVHTYQEPGNYQVCLTAGSICGTNISCQTITVTCSAPVAAFNQSQNELEVSFSDNAQNGPESWLWEFGDGNTSTEQNPQNSYNAPGAYEVCLTVTSVCGTNQYCETINVACAPPQAVFTFNNSELNVSFQDNSLNEPQSWFWNFGDGNTSSEANPQHVYSEPGDYEVCLTITGLCGSDEFCQNLTVACTAPQADFSSQIEELFIQFEDKSLNEPETWLWNFGDGTTSGEQNPSHQYLTPGNYTVCLETSSICGVTERCEQLSLSCTPPNPTITSQIEDLSVQFEDDLAIQVLNRLWDFGDGNVSIEASPSHTYATGGVYMVCLTAVTICGNFEACIDINVSCAAPTALFSTIDNDGTIFFVDASLGEPTSWFWEFGDGDTATVQNPTHSYEFSGSYEVCLVASSLCGIDTSCQIIVTSVNGLDLVEQGWEIQLFPNPVQDQLNLQIEGPATLDGQISFFNTLGQRLSAIDQIIPAGSQHIQLTTNDLEPGLYWVRLESEQGYLIRSFVKQ